MQSTPNANRLQIGLFGARNLGKSSLLNAIAKENVSTVSNVPGTTTDPVKKAMELPNIGAVLFLDTAGFDDEGILGDLRVEKTTETTKSADISIIFFDDESFEDAIKFLPNLKNTKKIAVINKIDELEDNGKSLAKKIKEKTKLKPVLVSAKTGEGISKLLDEILRVMPEDFETPSITGNLVKENDAVLLVMPQDKAAPKGRLILPQVQTIREILDKGAIPVCSTVENMEATLKKLADPPNLIITDSQAFKKVMKLKPKNTPITSFSILFGNHKGDIEYFTNSAKKMLELKRNAKILIAEACSHRPLEEDIGQVKIPNLLRKKLGDEIEVEFKSGRDFPADLNGYDLIIHCGSCMFNRRYVLSRVEAAKAANIPMTNYGVAIAALLGILDNVIIPQRAC
ncbi:MAG: [Selenomonadaceae bacterium]|nr:[FeFe] hydrogenase H-cluster maturation GTPase HydF [Selenomonadaceae bacterium]